MRGARGVVGVLLMLAPAIVALADDPPQAPEPTAEHEALAVWVGTWSGSGQMKESPFGPGGPMTWSEECEWFADGRFHVVCRSHGDSPTGPMTGLGIMGYDAGKGVYTHYGVDSSGWSGYSEGTRDGDVWTFTSTERMGDATYHSRFTLEVESARRTAFTWEMSEDGEHWVTLMTGSNSKGRAGASPVAQDP